MTDLGDFQVNSFAQIQAKLAQLEVELAQILGLSPEVNIRKTLIEMDRVGELPESELVRDWHDMYERLLNSATV